MNSGYARGRNALKHNMAFNPFTKISNWKSLAFVCFLGKAHISKLYKTAQLRLDFLTSRAAAWSIDESLVVLLVGGTFYSHFSPSIPTP